MAYSVKEENLICTNIIEIDTTVQLQIIMRGMLLLFDCIRQFIVDRFMWCWLVDWVLSIKLVF